MLTIVDKKCKKQLNLFFAGKYGIEKWHFVFSQKTFFDILLTSESQNGIMYGIKYVATRIVESDLFSLDVYNETLLANYSSQILLGI